MKRARILAYGIIPINETPNGLEVLLVEQYSAEGTHWGFPKGATISGEQPLETALREAREETGLTFKEVIDEAHFTVNYSFTYENTIADKTVTYFIGYVNQPGVAFRQSEIKDGGWYSFADAREKLTFSNTKEVFDAAVQYLTQYKSHA